MLENSIVFVGKALNEMYGNIDETHSGSLAFLVSQKFINIKGKSSLGNGKCSFFLP